MNYATALTQLMNEYEYTPSPRGKQVREILNFQGQFKHDEVVFNNNVRGTPMKYLAAELCWYLAMDLKIDFIQIFAPFWKTIADKHQRINSNYGKLVFGSKQWRWAISSLVEDKDSRQAVIHYNNVTHQVKGVKDFPCTMYNILTIRDNTLHMTARMRSNDIIRGLTFDLPWFSFVHQQAFEVLRQVYPALTLAPYLTFSADSLHIYSEHFDLADQMLAEPFVFSALPRCKVATERGIPSTFYGDMVYGSNVPLPGNTLEQFIYDTIKDFV